MNKTITIDGEKVYVSNLSDDDILGALMDLLGRSDWEGAEKLIGDLRA